MIQSLLTTLAENPHAIETVSVAMLLGAFKAHDLIRERRTSRTGVEGLEKVAESVSKIDGKLDGVTVSLARVETNVTAVGDRVTRIEDQMDQAQLRETLLHGTLKPTRNS